MTKKIGERISWLEEDGTKYISVNQRPPSWQLNAVIAWLVLWTACGGIIIYYLTSGFLDPFFFLTYLMFWAYFEYYVAKQLLWFTKGKELLKIDDEKVSYKKDWIGYGGMKHFYKSNIRQIELKKEEITKLEKFGAAAFWNPGPATIKISYTGKDQMIGLKLEEQDARKLMNLLVK